MVSSSFDPRDGNPFRGSISLKGQIMELDYTDEQDRELIEFLLSKEPNKTLSDEAILRFKTLKHAKRG